MGLRMAKIQSETGRPTTVEPLLRRLAARVAEIDLEAQGYLDRLPFRSTGWMRAALYFLACRKFKAAGEDWDKVEDWVASTVDSGYPPGGDPPPGSLYSLLAFSVVSRDAHLRRLIECAMGRASGELPFPIYAEWPEITPEIKPKRQRKKRVKTDNS